MRRNLRTAMILSAVASLASGVLIAAAPSNVGDWLGVEIDNWLRLFGLVLVGHGALLLGALSKFDEMKLGKLNLLLIAPYPLLMVLLVATGRIDRRLGQGLALVDGAAIAGIAAMHLNGLKTAK